MAKTPLRTLRIREFRGSAKDFSIGFDSSKPLTLIYGENGSGKTTICDAFDFIGNGKVGSLDNRGLGAGTHSYWPCLGKKSDDILVELSLDGVQWNAKAKGRDRILSPADKRLPRIEVLRRSSILQLVQEQPADRYKALKPFIDIATVEAAEKALREQIKDSEAALNQAASRLGENAETLRRLMAEAGGSGGNAIEWARDAVSKPPQDVTTDVQQLRAAVQAIQTALTHVGTISDARSTCNAAETTSAGAEAALSEAEKHSLAEDAALIQILSAAKTHFTTHGTGNACPLCESAENIADLAQKVDARLLAVEKIQQAQEALAAAKKKADSAKENLGTVLARAKQSLSGASEKSALAKNEWRQANASALASLSSEGISKPLEIEVDTDSLNAACDGATQLCTSLEASTAWYKIAKTALEQYDQNIERQSGVSKVLPRLRKALDVCESQRKQFMDSILGVIANEVGRIYEAIHPGEGLGKISLNLVPNKIGSLELGAEFMGKKDQPPPAFFSESHLDSLGLCIFLALAGRQSPDNTIVVMDDVLGSIDEPHVDRLINILYDEAKRFKHTIITTHYQPWREKFRWGWLKNGQCEMIELGLWNSASGISTTKASHHPLFELRQHLTASPVVLQSACASAGVLLEAICDYLTALYECDVPRRKGKLTLGDMLPKVADKNLAAALRVEIKQSDGSYTNTPLGETFIKLREMASLRNIFGCHYNDLAHHLPQQDAIQFATLVHELGSALICSDQGWPGSDKSGSYWATKEETRRLHPLKKPHK